MIVGKWPEGHLQCFLRGKNRLIGVSDQVLSANLMASFMTMQAENRFWSDQETLLLLEGVELFGDNWQDIADHVGKSQVFD